MFKLVLEKAEEPEIKFPTSGQIIEKARAFHKDIYFCLIDYMKNFVYILTNCGKFLNRWEYQTTWPAPWETCMQAKKQQLEPDTVNGLVQNQKRSMPRLYILTLLI